MMYGYWNCFSPGSRWMMMSGMSIFWILLIALFIIAFIRMKKANQHQRVSVENSPINILNERLAKGEISEEEYERLKRIIK